MTPSRNRLQPLAALLILPLMACETPTSVATDAKRIAEHIGHVRPSCSDTAETRRQTAEQSSKIDSIVQGKEIVYKDSCPPRSLSKPMS